MNRHVASRTSQQLDPRRLATWREVSPAIVYSAALARTHRLAAVPNRMAILNLRRSLRPNLHHTACTFRCLSLRYDPCEDTIDTGFSLGRYRTTPLNRSYPRETHFSRATGLRSVPEKRFRLTLGDGSAEGDGTGSVLGLGLVRSVSVHGSILTEGGRWAS